jgi:hypothetical protein
MAAMVSSEVPYAVGNLNGLEDVSQSPEEIRQEIWGFEHSRGECQEEHRMTRSLLRMSFQVAKVVSFF